ncbi:MAG: hypothetical protein ACRESZ_08255 [Methylococcales bacterium]
MKINQAMQSMRWLLGFLPGLIAIYIAGCNVTQERPRPRYAQEFHESYMDPVPLGVSYRTQKNTRLEIDVGAPDGPLANQAPGAPVENPGRPGPRPSEIPGISDIPEIPDEPTVLPE